MIDVALIPNYMKDEAGHDEYFGYIGANTLVIDCP